MKIDLTKIPSFWLTAEKCKDRWPRMEAMLREVGIPAEKIVGPEENPYTLGVAKGYSMALEKFHYKEDFGTMDEPMLLLEDDCEICYDFDPVLEIPQCDALFLGTSLYGINFGQTQFGGTVAKDCGEYLQLANMLSFHAVLIISARYKKHLWSLFANFDGDGGVDRRVAETMMDFKILGVKQPFWYQKDGHSHQATATPIRPIF